ncbi:RAMP superfamily CRISPR-associated protein [Tepidibacillus fermentans]|uniref:CRISPR-associated protein Csx10 n=1 Tax=Tepidibacillus fermentans TaxID=1281767 RepID=A0A4R3K7K6_9BACI|nr:RAMP superfamily CRISPR-associated protein [Tepidibacillus fermentans]TCS78934.1 CRISPR-associated protein Csx10 [Tepidibacillus fermentans]
MTRYITFEIKTLEDIKMGSQGSQIDNQYALSYIAGSTIRGAFIHQYLKRYPELDISKNEQARKMLLSGGMKFLNAYPAQNDKRTFPFPVCFYTDKETLKKFDGTGVLEVLNEFMDPICEDDKRFGLGEFCIFDEERIQLISVEKVFHLHINKREEKENLFRYEAIKQGQTFIGVIAVETEFFDQIDEIVQLMDQQIFYLGGSKGSGYGKCLIKNVTLVDKNPELINEVDEEMFFGEFFIYVMSDIISRDGNGQIISYIDEAYLKDHLELESVQLQQSSIQTRVSSGYNNHWGTRLPQNIAIKAGSIFKYKYQGELKKKRMEQLMDHGIGDRREEGFGRIVILDSLLGSEIELIHEKNHITFDSSLVTQQDQHQLKMILTDIYQQIVEKERPLKVLELNEKTKWDPLKRSSSQIGKLLELSINLQSVQPEEGKKQFLEYFNHLEKKANSTKAFFKLKDVKVNENNIVDYLREFIHHLDDIELFKRNYLITRKQIKLGNIEPELSKKYVYKSNLKFLEDYFRLGLREVRKGE